MASFDSNDTPLEELLKKIKDGDVQLPDFQRGWVWDDNRIRSLIASIISSYPMGALMFLAYCKDSANFKYHEFTNAPKYPGKNPEFLVLDGQQRLTSVFSAMYSTEPVPTQTDKKKEIKRFYYLDMKKCLDKSEDRFDAIISIPETKIVKSDFGRMVEIDLTTRDKEFEQHCFPLNLIFSPTENMAWQNQYRKYHKYDEAIMALCDDFSNRIIAETSKYKVPVIKLGKDVPKEAVCQVFENVNTGGVSLTVFELITATFAADNFELRKDWEEIKCELYKDDILRDVVSATDFITATTLLVSMKRRLNDPDATVGCKKKDVLSLKLKDYEDNRLLLKSGFLDASRFLREQCIYSNRNLPYTTQLIPLAVIFTIIGNQSHHTSVKQKIAQWYWCGVMGEMYGSANETRFALDVLGVISWVNTGSELPDTIQRAYFNPNRLLSMQSRLSAAYKGIMALLLQNGCYDFISGTRMDFSTFNEESIDIHHIFPQDWCVKQGKDRNRWNSIINKTPLSYKTNRCIGGNAPSRYLSQIVQEGRVDNSSLDKYLVSHKIDVQFIRNDDFDAFFLDRAKSLLGMITKATGKEVSSLPEQEAVERFGGKLN